jgi:phosphohistidine phosphatase
MSKTLYLLRHAKSSWDDPTLADHDRPLAPRGERNVATMGPRWAAWGVRPERIVSSTAARALATARSVAEALALPPQDLVVDGCIYASTPAALRSLVAALDPALSRVMLVGHNPEFTELAGHMAPEIEHLPTCALVELVFDVNAWTALAHARPVRVTFESPKHLLDEPPRFAP